MKRGWPQAVGALVVTGAVLATTMSAAQAAPGRAPVLKLARNGSTTTASPGVPVAWVTTTGDPSQLLAEQPGLSFGDARPTRNVIDVDDSTVLQSVRGVGAAMTESSAELIGQLPATARTQVLHDLFSTTGAGISVVRLPLGASDFALSDYTYDDAPPGTQDPGLAAFDASRDLGGSAGLLAQAAVLRPRLSVMATPWSAPAWMKTSGTTHGGELAVDNETDYANYLVRSVQTLRANGVPVVALSVANEPEYSTPAYPSMAMSAAQQVRFVGEDLRPALDAGGLNDVRVLGYDHNWDDTAYPSQLLTSSYGSAFGGVAFHCYGGDVSAQSQVNGLTPSDEMWTSECSGGSWATDFTSNLQWGASNMLIGAFRNHSTASLWWNLALDPTGGPTNGGCTTCRGVVTIDPANGAVTRNVEWYLLAHVGRYVVPGAHVVGSTATTASGVSSVAFRNPDGLHALITLNPNATSQTVTLRWKGSTLRVSLSSHSLSTFRW
ncbi:MAG: glycoside hydrolase family 30 protein [Actinomycetes bacterium]